MYQFHYDYIKNEFCKKSMKCFMYEVRNEDVCEDFRRDKEMFNFSNYSAK